jgi:VCBS repeat-containing protein
MTVTKEFAVKIDTELADLYDQIWVINSEIISYQDYTKSTQSSRYMSDADKVSHIAKYAEKIDELQIKRAPLKDRVRELNKIYILNPWTRAFLVINANGHVHSSMECSTCFDTTRYNWLVQYSNDDEATIVADAGQDACTVCYPSAPADVLNRPSRIVTADKIAKAQAKADRDAKRQAKIAKEKASAPTASGEFLYIKDGKYTQEIKTERTAVIEFKSNYSRSTDAIVTHYYDGTAHTAESIAHQEARRANSQHICTIIAQALAGKHGVSFDEMWATLVKKAKVA